MAELKYVNNMYNLNFTNTTIAVQDAYNYINWLSVA